MKKLVACLTAVCCLAGGISAIIASADEKFTEQQFYVVSLTSPLDYDGYFLHCYSELLPAHAPKYQTEFIRMNPKNATVTGDKTSDYQYGDILVIDYKSAYDSQDSYPPQYYIPASNMGEVHYAGNCKDILESKELTLTRKEEKPHWVDPLDAVESITFYFEDDAGNEYSYLEYYYSKPPEIDLNLYDIGDTVTFSVYHDTLILPLKEELHIKPVQPELMKGDASGDDEVNVLDVIEINRAVLGKSVLSEEQTKAADVDGNGIIDAADSLLILKYLVGIVESL